MAQLFCPRLLLRPVSSATFKVWLLVPHAQCERIELIKPDSVIPDAEFEAPNKLERNERYSYPFRWGNDVFAELGAEEAERRAEEHAASQKQAHSFSSVFCVVGNNLSLSIELTY